MTIVTLVVLMLATAWTLRVIPESIHIKYVNDKYIEEPFGNIRRYGRNSPYYINIRAVTKHVWANNVSFHVVLTEYLHNEYRPSFIELHYKLCDLIQNEPYIGGTIKSKGVTCPIPQGRLNLMNTTILAQNFPNVWPFEKGGANVRLAMTGTDETMAEFEIHLKFVQKKLLAKE